MAATAPVPAAGSASAALTPRWPSTGLGELHPALWHVLAANPEGHVSTGVGGPRECHREITPQQPL